MYTLASYTDAALLACSMEADTLELGGNAIVGVKLVSSSVAAGASEILAYGTAVVVEPSD